MLEFGKQARVDPGAFLFHKFLRLGDRELADDPAVPGHAIARGKEKDLHRLHRLGHFEGDAVGVHAKGFSLAVVAQRRDHGDDALVQKQVQRLRVHALDAAGVELIDAAEDARRMRDDRVGVGRPQIDGREALHDLRHHVRRRFEAHLERGVVGDADSVRVGNRDAALGGELRDLQARAVDEDHLDAQRAQHREIEQEVREIRRRHDLAVDRDYEDFFAEARDVLENAAQVGDFHRRR